MAKKSHSLRTTITVREAWLIFEALELQIAADRTERAYARISELAKLSDHMHDLWSDNSHLDYKGEADMEPIIDNIKKISATK